MNLYRILCCFLLIATVKPFAATANHAAGGEIYYEWLSDSTYRVFMKLYRDCSGDAEPSTMPICLRNTCNNNTYSYTMTKYSPTGVPSSLFCPKYKTKCDSLQSTFTGNITWTYSAIVTFPARCSSWKIFTYTSHRSAAANLSNATSSGLYIEATLNNQVAQGNSSPYFSAPPLNYAFTNNGMGHADKAIDPDGDSLVFSITNPLTGVANCSNIAINSTFSSSNYNITSNPFNTNNTFGINPYTGVFNFTAATTGNHTLAILVREYRNGVLIGSVMRETSIQTFPFIKSGPTWVSNYKDSFSNCYDDGYKRIYGCVGYPMRFTIHVVGSTDTAIWSISHHPLALATMPGSAITYSGQGTDSVSVTFTWTPAITEAGFHSIIFIVKDSSCKPFGPLFSTITQDIYIFPPMKAMPDAHVCPQDPITLWATADVSYIWNVISGTPNSLSCYNCPNPIAAPTVVTKYEVSGMVCSFRDTVTLYPSPGSYPTISVTASDTNIVTGTNVSFTANTACKYPYYQWLVNGNPEVGATSATWSTTTLKDKDEVSCKLSCGDTCSTPNDTISNKLTMHVSLGIGKTSNNNNDFVLYPNPNNGNFTLELKNMNNALVEITDITGRTIYQMEFNSRVCNINLPAISNGLYLLKLRTVDDVKTEAFTVNR